MPLLIDASSRLRKEWDGDFPLREPIPRSALLLCEKADQELQFGKHGLILHLIDIDLPSDNFLLILIDEQDNTRMLQVLQHLTLLKEKTPIKCLATPIKTNKLNYIRN